MGMDLKSIIVLILFFIALSITFFLNKIPIVYYPFWNHSKDNGNNDSKKGVEIHHGSSEYSKLSDKDISGKLHDGDESKTEIPMNEQKCNSETNLTTDKNYENGKYQAIQMMQNESENQVLLNDQQYGIIGEEQYPKNTYLSQIRKVRTVLTDDSCSQADEHPACDMISKDNENEKKRACPIRVYWLHFSIGQIAIFILFVLIVTQLLTWEILWNSLMGTEGSIAGYSVLIIFFSFAYICLSLDSTQVLKAIALAFLSNTKSKWRLFFTFQALASLMTLFTSNDIVILTLTPILCYVYQIHKSKGFNPIPYAFSLFYMSNICSIFFVIGNPTNVVVAEAEKLNFGIYSLWMFLPAIGLPLVAVLMLSLLFFRIIRKSSSIIVEDPISNIEKSIVEINDVKSEIISEINNEDVRVKGEINNDKTKDVVIEIVKKKSWGVIKEISRHIRDPVSVVFKICGFIISLVTLFVTSIFNVPAWSISLGFCVLFLLWDLFRDSIDIFLGLFVFKEFRKKVKISEETKNSSKFLGFIQKFSLFFNFIFRRSHFLQTVWRMPWSIAPFVLCMFVFVELLRIHGWIDLLAKGMVIMIRIFSFGFDQKDSLGLIFSSVLVLNVSGIIMSNLINNQPATILFIIVFKSSIMIEFYSDSPFARLAGLLSLVIASNIAACFTLYGSLAGIMWQGLLKRYGVRISYFRFLLYGIFIITSLCIATCIILTLEVYIVKVIRDW